jgi:phosphoglycolate phosphatase
MSDSFNKLTVDLIVFDLDGTLADTLPDLAVAANHACRTLGLPEHNISAIQQMIGGGEQNFVRRFLGEKNQKYFDKALSLYLEQYSRHCADLTRLYPGVKETLAELSHKKLAVLSNKMERLTRQLVQLMGLEHFFALVKGGDSYGALKPSAAGLTAIIAELGAVPQRTLMVGDKSADVMVGHGAGARTLAVTYGYGDLASLRAAAPDFFIDRFSALPSRLD